MMPNTTTALESTSGEAAVLKKVEIESKINGLLAEVSVEQEYCNQQDTNIEAVYTFPLPFDAVLLGFGIEIGGRRLEGSVVEKSASDVLYEDAIIEGDAAALLEQIQPGLYTASLGNLLPNETARIWFRYALLLRWNGNSVRFMMPTTIAPRYGDPAAAGLMHHQTPEFAFDAAQSFTLKVMVEGLLTAADFTSPSHDISVTPGSKETIIDIVGTPAMDRDFVLEANLSAVQASSVNRGVDQKGWVALASFRPEIPDDEQRKPRYIKIVVDCSGSMAGDSIFQAGVAIGQILDDLREGDLFEIIRFGSYHQVLFGTGTPVSEMSLKRARELVSTLDADMGGTEIGAALEAAYDVDGERELPRDILLITDGEVWDTDIIVQAEQYGHRIFTVGVGSAVAEPFVRELAEATGGACELVAPGQDMAEHIHRHFQRMYAPRAEGASVHWPAPPLRTLPDSIDTVYGGDTLHVFAWFAEKPEGAISLDITMPDGRAIRHETSIVPLDESSTTPENSEDLPATLARIAGARRLVAMTENEAATELAVRYQLMSQWTNYFVVHVRADGGKSDSLPEIRKVPQAFAAGSHGAGTVALPLRLEPSSYIAESAAPMKEDLIEIPSFMRRASAASEPPASYSAALSADKPRPSKITREVSDLAKLIKFLNVYTIQRLPTLDDLEALNFGNRTICRRLRAAVADGREERAVILEFLFNLMARSEVDGKVDRATRRRIRAEHKNLEKQNQIFEPTHQTLVRQAVQSLLNSESQEVET